MVSAEVLTPQFTLFEALNAISAKWKTGKFIIFEVYLFLSLFSFPMYFELTNTEN
jgi:hypothetical protein